MGVIWVREAVFEGRNRQTQVTEYDNLSPLPELPPGLCQTSPARLSYLIIKPYTTVMYVLHLIHGHSSTFLLIFALLSVFIE